MGMSVAAKESQLTFSNEKKENGILLTASKVECVCVNVSMCGVRA